MKKRKNGFTLVELISVIVLLAILMTIAITSVSSIKSRVNERRYTQLASTIEVAAERFAADTGAQTILVQTLINTGLIEADNETGNVVDPRDGSTSLNCQKIIVEGDNAILKDDPDPECDEELLRNSQLAIRFRYNDKDQKDAEGTKRLFSDLKDGWTNKSIVLFVEPLGGLTLDGSEKYSWISPLAPDDVYKGKEFAVDEVNVSDTYRVTIVKEGVEYRSEQLVKVDKVAPLVSDFYVSNPNSWTIKKEVNFKITDSGSGIAGYGFSSSPTEEPKIWKEPENKYTENVSKLELDFNGIEGFADTEKLYIWTKDIAGNISANENSLGTGLGFDVNIDFDGADGCIGTPEENAKNPDCQMKISKSPDTWTREITLTGTAKDSKSGLVAYQFTNSAEEPSEWQTITKTNEKVEKISGEYRKSSDYYFWVKDAVGNVSGIQIIADNVDRIAPTVGVTGAPEEWTKDDIELTITAEDTRKNYNGDIVDGANYEGKIYEDQEEQATKASGVNKYICTKSSTPPSDVSGYPKKYLEENNTCKITDYGIYYVWAIDHAGNIMNSDGSGPSSGDDGSKGIEVKIDKSAPVVNISADYGSGSSWTNRDVTLTGSARDNLSGVAATKFDTSSYATMTPENSKTVTKTKVLSKNTNEGTSNHTFWAKDQLGHEDHASIQINIDKTAPKITNITKSPSSGWVSSVTISFSASDPTPSGVNAVSGIKETKCNGVSGKSCTVSGNGTYTLTATDYAGNTTTETVKVENIDNSAPSLAITKSPSNYTCSNSVTFTLNGSDTQSGINTSTYYCNNSRSQTCTVSSPGTYYFSVTDNAGKTKTESVTVTFDNTRPVYNGGAVVNKSYLNAGNWSDNCGIVSYEFAYSTTYVSNPNSLYWYANRPKQWNWIPNLTCGMTNYAWVRVCDAKGCSNPLYLGSWYAGACAPPPPSIYCNAVALNYSDYGCPRCCPCNNSDGSLLLIERGERFPTGAIHAQNGTSLTNQRCS